MKHLLIVYHSKTGNTARLAEAVIEGAKDEAVQGVEVRVRLARQAGAEDLLWAHALLLGTPENFGYMSGALKDFFDRTFYEVEGQVQGKPYCLVIGTGNDGMGAISAIRRICNGYNFREVQEPVLVVGDLADGDLNRCQELGLAMAAGLEAGVF